MLSNHFPNNSGNIYFSFLCHAMFTTSDLYTGNPNFPYTYFPFDKEKQEVDFAILYGEVYNEKGEYVRSLSTKETNQLCTEVKETLKLNFLDWGFVIGRRLLSIHITDLPKVYQIIQEFLRHGQRIYMQDHTQVTFDPQHLKDGLVNYVGQQYLFLKTLHSLKKIFWKTDYPRQQEFTIATAIPFHRDPFWTIPEGKEFAREYREKTQLPDVTNPKSLYNGEYFAEGFDKREGEPISKKPRIDLVLPGQVIASISQEELFRQLHVSVDDSGKIRNETELCVVCDEREANTMVLPCNHCKVCKECSDKLKTDKLNSDKCVYCRTPITNVLD